MEELKPCHCGYKAALFQNASGWKVKCEFCGMRTASYPDQWSPVEEWNDRPIEDALRAENERLRKVLIELRRWIDDDHDADCSWRNGRGDCDCYARFGLEIVDRALRGGKDAEK